MAGLTTFPLCMLQLQQVLDILNDKSTNKSPDHIKRWRDVYYGISLHIKGAQPEYKLNGKTIRPEGYYGKEYQYIFDNYLFARHPRESEDTRQWRYSQYRPFQKQAFLKIIDICTGAMLQDSNYGVEVANKKDHDYIWGNNFSGYDIIRYFERSFKSVVEDPNGFFIRIPKQAWNATTTTDIQPDIWFVNSKDILYHESGDVIFKRDGYAWHVNTIAIFRYEHRKDQQGGGKWQLADAGGYYAHGFGYLPIDVAGGNHNTEGYYDSWLVGAKAVADEIVAAKSAEQMVDKEASHPWIIVAQTDCPDCDGSGDMQTECERSDLYPDGIRLVKCSSCKGTRKKSNQSPGDRLEVPAELMKDDLLKVVVPPVEVNKHHLEKNGKLMEALLDALHLLRVQEAQSGVAKALDQEALHQFLTKISNDFFDRIIFNTVRDITAYRNVTTIEGETRPAIQQYTIVKPTQFQIKTAQDLLKEYDDGTKAAVPVFMRVRAMLDLVDKQYSGDKTMKKKAEVIGRMDFLCVCTRDERDAMVTYGEATNRDLQFSARLPQILDNLIADKTADWFLKSDYKTIKVEVDALFDDLVPVPPVIMPNNKTMKQNAVA